MGWLNYKFDVAKTHLSFTPLGKALKDKGVEDQEIIRTPRAIDFIEVVLIKRETTQDEKQIARLFNHKFHMF